MPNIMKRRLRFKRRIAFINAFDWSLLYCLVSQKYSMCLAKFDASFIAESLPRCFGVSFTFVARYNILYAQYKNVWDIQFDSLNGS